MVSLIEELKAEARLMHRQVGERDGQAMARMGLHDGDDVAEIKRRHCLAVVAKELGFAGWPNVVAALGGEATADYGTLLYPSGGAAHSNIWCKTYEEARDIREQNDGYLLAYRHQFFVVDRYFIETLGLDPDDSDWEDLGRDWVRPKQPQARVRLYRKLIRGRTG